MMNEKMSLQGAPRAMRSALTRVWQSMYTKICEMAAFVSLSRKDITI